MKKLILILAALYLGAPHTAKAEQTRVVLQYDMGNQITRTGLIILSNGTVMRQETLMGKTTYLEDLKLTKSKLKSLIAQIDEAALAAMIRNDNVSASEGGLYGEAKIFTSDGYVSYLYAIVAGDSMKKTIVCQPGAAAEAIRLIIQTLVRDQMPLDQVPCK